MKTINKSLSIIGYMAVGILSITAFLTVITIILPFFGIYGLYQIGKTAQDTTPESFIEGIEMIADFSRNNHSI